MRSSEPATSLSFPLSGSGIRSGNVQIRLIPRTSRSIASPPSLRRSISTRQFIIIGTSVRTTRGRSSMRIEFPSRSRVAARAAIEPIASSNALIQAIGGSMSNPKTDELSGESQCRWRDQVRQYRRWRVFSIDHQSMSDSVASHCLTREGKG